MTARTGSANLPESACRLAGASLAPNPARALGRLEACLAGRAGRGKQLSGTTTGTRQ